MPKQGNSVPDLRLPKTDYSRIADYYDKARPPPADIWVSKIIEYGGINESSKVLDIGCGTGRFSLSVQSSKKLLMCALEPSLEMLSKGIAKDESKRVLWVQGDGQKLPFRDDFFDSVYMTLVIHHIEDKESALREIHRVLRREGGCVIMTNSHHRMKRQILRYFPGLIAIDLKRSPTIPELKSLMIEVGFRNVHYHVINHGQEFLSIDEYMERVRKKYISTLTLLSEEEFQRGVKVFEKRVRQKYGEQITRILGFDFVVGRK